MISYKNVSDRRNRSLVILASLLLALGGVALYRGSNVLGGIACVAGVYLIGKSKGQKPTNPPGPLMWTLGAASLVLMGVSYFFLYNDATHGYQQIWPVYLFACIGVVCGLFLSVLVARLM